MKGKLSYQVPLPAFSQDDSVTNSTADEGESPEQAIAPSSKYIQANDSNFAESFSQYLDSSDIYPLLFEADAALALGELPTHSIDFVMTSPPYWGKREYDNGGIGLEETWQEYLQALDIVFAQVKRILKPSGSFWLNIGDRYLDKGLVGIPWRIALRLTDNHGWILRNNVVWNKVKSGMDSTDDRLGNIHEPVFHFVKKPRGYYYDVDAIRSKPRSTRIKNGVVVTATGVSGVRYRRQIELSTSLSSTEKERAYIALEDVLNEVIAGKISDFRMIIRGQQRVTHSNSNRVSGRARELGNKGFYFLKYHPNGSKPSDVWDILPEDTQKRNLHFAPYPEDLCRIPLLATCPPEGIALDPFCGTGTTLRVAFNMGRKSVGIDRSLAQLKLDHYRGYSR